MGFSCGSFVRVSAAGIVACFSLLRAQQVLDINLGSSPIAIDRSAAPAIYVGRFRSLDGGATWTTCFLTDPAGGPNVFTSTPETSAVLKSANRGESWKTILIFPEAALGGTRLAASDTYPRNIYGAAPRGVYLSTDEGETWRPLQGTVRATLAIPAQDLQLRVAAGGPRAGPDSGRVDGVRRRWRSGLRHLDRRWRRVRIPDHRRWSGGRARVDPEPLGRRDGFLRPPADRRHRSQPLPTAFCPIRRVASTLPVATATGCARWMLPARSGPSPAPAPPASAFRICPRAITRW